MIIWLASYPRSGNTLLRIILNAAFDRRTYSKHDDATDIAADARTAEAVGHEPLDGPWERAYPAMRDAGVPFFVKTHDAPEDDAPAIYVVRDGRDASVSYHHYLRDFTAGGTATGLSDVILGFTPFGSWGSHLDRWDPARRPNTLLLRYEDVVADPASAIGRVAEFARVPAVRTWENNFEELHRINPRFFRAGPGKRNAAELSEEDAALFWSLHADWMRELGYEVPESLPTAAVGLRAGLARRGRESSDAVFTGRHLERQLQEAWRRAARLEAELRADRDGVAATLAQLERTEAELQAAREHARSLGGRVAEARGLLRRMSDRATELEEQYRQARSGLMKASNRLAMAEAHLGAMERSRVCRALVGLGVLNSPAVGAGGAGGGEGDRQAVVPSSPPPPLPDADRLAKPAAALDGALDEVGRALGVLGKGAAGPAVVLPAGPAESGDQMDRALAHLVRKGFRPAVILDVGAAKGYWSERTSWHYFRDAEYFMIDPLPASEGHLKELTERSERFKYLLMAVGSVPGEVEMNVTADCDGSSLLEFPGGGAAERRVVPVETLDRLLADGRIKPAELIKMDVQGYEMEVIRGAGEVLRRAEVVIIEVNCFEFMPKTPLAHEVVCAMAERGFRLFDFAGFLRRPFEDDLGQADFVFVRDDSPLVASNRWS